MLGLFFSFCLFSGGKIPTNQLEEAGPDQSSDQPTENIGDNWGRNGSTPFSEKISDDCLSSTCC